jgi:hypothetical protein
MGVNSDKSPTATVASLPTLFLELIGLVSNDSADSLARKTQVIQEIRTTLVLPATIAALTKEADNNAPQGSVLHSFQQALSPKAPHELRLLALRQLFLLIGHALAPELRLAAVGALMRCQIPQQIIEQCFFDEKIDIAEAATRFLSRFASDPNEQV